MDLSFDPETMDSAVQRCLAWCEGPRAPHTVITANAGVLCMMRRDPELREACRAGDLVARRRHVGGLGAPEARARRFRSG